MRKILYALLILSGLGAQAQSIKEVMNSGRPMLAAHRGGYYDDRAENSLSSLEFLSSSLRPDLIMVEIDIRQSKNGTLWLMHDNTVDRTTNGHGDIASLEDGYLKSLKLKNGAGDLTGEGIPTFEEALEKASKHNVLLMLDVKIDDWKKILDLVEVKKMTSRCLVLTFTLKNSQTVASLSSDILLSCLVKTNQDFEDLKKAGINTNRMMAYLNQPVDNRLVMSLLGAGVPLLTDASEATRNNSKVYETQWYRDLLISKKIKLLVTDFPVEVHKALTYR